MNPDPFSPERFEKFFEFVELVTAPPGLEHLGECWIWTGCTDASGYGRFYCPGFPTLNGGIKRSHSVLAHRWCVAFWYGVGKLKGLTHDHLCRRTKCVNPRHGKAITRVENVIRGNQLRHIPIHEDPFEALGF